jgi:hypothetical protein
MPNHRPRRRAGPPFSPGEVTYFAYDRDGNLVSKLCLSRAMFQVPGGFRPMPPPPADDPDPDEPDEPFIVDG